MKKARIISMILWVLIVAPIWYYLLYKILIAIHASELMMFLFWIYLPVGLIVTIISRLTGDEDN